MLSPSLQMIDITKAFLGVQALSQVTVEAYSGSVLALVGANGAGKSTLMNILGGVLRADSGEILLNGKPITIHSPLDATAHGIAFVHQEMAMLPTMTVAENMYISGFPQQRGLIDQRAMREQAAKVLQRLGCRFSPDTQVRMLNTGNRQMVEIARALLNNPQILIFDEPTSSLTSREKARLFEVISTLKAEGVTIIYITHFLDEIFQICDRATVLRGGQVAGSGLISELDAAQIVHMIIGNLEVDALPKPVATEQGEIALRVNSLNRKGVLSNIQFELRRGEIVGLWGLLGSGRTELARAVIELDPIDSGSIEVNDGSRLRPFRSGEAQKWIGLLTEDRRNEGLLLPMSVRQNLSLANLRSLTSFFRLIRHGEEVRQANALVKRLNIKLANLEQPARTLSGGNQQKVVIGRWLEVSPRVFIMDEPMRGLDVGAKAEIRNIIFELAEGGTALLVISSEIDEIMSLCSRYLVMARGEIVRQFSRDVSRNELMAAAAGVDRMEGATRGSK